MMDANKAQVLREIQYQILPTCANCEWGIFRDKSDWGTCDLYEYEHVKHTDEARQLSIHTSGTCPKFQLNEQVRYELHGFAEFL